MAEMISHPQHYNIEGRKECIVEMLEKYGFHAVANFALLNSYKYLYRMGLKYGNPSENDLKKAQWYFDWVDNKAGELKEYDVYNWELYWDICKGLQDEKQLPWVEVKYMDSVVNWAESCIGTKLTEEEIKRIEEDAKRSKEINTVSVEVLKRYGIDLMPETFNESCLEKERKIFKLVCIYQAKTELYDRTLTSRRSLYDPTEAFLDNGFVRSQSNKYACMLRETIVEFVRLKLDIPTDEFRELFKRIIKSYHYTAQGWIDVYNHFKENGEMEFFEEWHRGWKPIEQVNEIGKSQEKIDVANLESDWRNNAVYLEDGCK